MATLTNALYRDSSADASGKIKIVEAFSRLDLSRHFPAIAMGELLDVVCLVAFIALLCLGVQS